MSTLFRKRAAFFALLLNFSIAGFGYCDSATSNLFREVVKGWQESENSSTRELGDAVGSNIDSYDQVRRQRDANRQRENDRRVCYRQCGDDFKARVAGGMRQGSPQDPILQSCISSCNY